MHKFLIPIATAASALAIAAPASAQFYGAPGYGNNYGYNNYGYNNQGYSYRGAYGGRQLVAVNRQRMARIHSQIEILARSGRASPGEVASLHREANRFDRELNRLARNGMTGQEGAIFDARVARLGQQIQARLGYGYNRYGYDRYDDYRRR